MMSLATQRFATGTTDRTNRSTIIAAAYDGFVSHTRPNEPRHDAQGDDPLAKRRSRRVRVPPTTAGNNHGMGHHSNMTSGSRGHFPRARRHGYSIPALRATREVASLHVLEVYR